MTLLYQLTNAAEADLRDIIRYTRRKWGVEQARKYASQLERCTENVARGDGNFKTMPELHPGLRVAKCQRHYIFCYPRTGESALIVAILHERMDLLARIVGRLPN